MCGRCVVRFFGRLFRNSAGILDVRQGISGQSAGKYASRLRAKPSGGLYSAFPYVPMNNVIITSLCKVCYRGNVKSRLNVKFCGMPFVNSEKSTEFRYIFSQHALRGQPFSQKILLKRQIPAMCWSYGNTASRLRAKPSGGLYAVFPYVRL